MLSRHEMIQRVKLTFTCISIAANALCAGGIFTFPLLSPALAEHLKLSQPQLTTIVLAGMIGQYPFAALVGKTIDQRGPWLCSLASSLLFSTGFGLFALEVAKTPDDITSPSQSSFERLALFFFMAGLGTVASYFSSLFAASKNFPEYIGIASGTSMALFGLSPMFLSVLASNFFTDRDGVLDVTRFVSFLAILCGVVHVIGAINMRTPKVQGLENEITDSQPDEENSHETRVNERTPLVKRRPSGDAQVVVVPVEQEQAVSDLLKDPLFWLLAMIVMFSLGSCEMVISNVGTIVLSFPSSVKISAADPSSTASTATQVRILSIANTVSRLLVGPLADFVSPVASYLSCGTATYPRKHRISRISFLTASSIILFITFGWMDVGIRARSALWMLSIGTGIAYGAVFTVLPSIVSSIWGLKNLGRNFGIITYAPFIGTPLFSYLYAFISASRVDDSQSDGVCRGVHCWQLTFTVTAMAAFASFLASIVLWRRWKGRV